MQVRAILFDTRSIQRYIFADNRLKTNIGASYIVSHVFEEVLLGDVLKSDAFGIKTIDTESWKEGKELNGELPADCYVAYIGGGNALLLFPDSLTSDVSNRPPSRSKCNVTPDPPYRLISFFVSVTLVCIR